MNKKYDIIFPHLNENSFDTNRVIEEVDLFIAEVSRPSLGLGIEIGRAEQKEKRILCIYKKGKKCSSSLKYVKVDMLEYNDEKDMINKLKEYIEDLNIV